MTHKSKVGEGAGKKEEKCHKLNLLGYPGLGTIGHGRRDESWSVNLCQTFFTMVVGVHIVTIPVLSPSTCVYKKFALDVPVSW